MYFAYNWGGAYKWGVLHFVYAAVHNFLFIHGDIYYGKIPMGLFHTAAILSQETEITLFYHPNLSPEFFTVRSRVVKENFSVSQHNMGAM